MLPFTKTCFSKWQKIETEVPQGSILGPFLFNISACDLFLILCNTYILQVMHMTTPPALSFKIQTLYPNHWRNYLSHFLSWFKESKLKLNVDQCYLMVLKKQKPSWITLLHIRKIIKLFKLKFQ